MSAIPVDELIANVSAREKSWRLAHDNVQVITVFEGEGETWCIHPLFCATEEKEIDEEIKRLGLKELPVDVSKGA